MDSMQDGKKRPHRLGSLTLTPGLLDTREGFTGRYRAVSKHLPWGRPRGSFPQGPSASVGVVELNKLEGILAETGCSRRGVLGLPLVSPILRA